jgi:effector-binding domain-containing protein
VIEAPRVVQTEARTTAVIPLVVPRADIQKVMGPAIQEVVSTLAAQGIRPAGPMVSYHRRIDAETFDFEVGFPVTQTVRPAGRVVASGLPAKRVVRTVYHGGYEGLHGAWTELMAWIKSSGYAAEGDMWEVYLTGPESGPDASKWRTELSRPIAED